MQRMKLPVIRFRKSPAQALEKQSFSQFGQFHRLGQPLRGRHSAQRLNVQASIDFRLEFHVSELYPKAAPKNHACQRDFAKARQTRILTSKL